MHEGAVSSITSIRSGFCVDAMKVKLPRALNWAVIVRMVQLAGIPESYISLALACLALLGHRCDHTGVPMPTTYHRCAPTGGTTCRGTPPSYGCITRHVAFTRIRPMVHPSTNLLRTGRSPPGHDRPRWIEVLPE